MTAQTPETERIGAIKTVGMKLLLVTIESAPGEGDFESEVEASDTVTVSGENSESPTRKLGQLEENLPDFVHEVRVKSFLDANEVVYRAIEDEASYVLFRQDGMEYEAEAFDKLVEASQLSDADLLLFGADGKNILGCESLNSSKPLYGLNNGKQALTKFVLNKVYLPHYCRLMASTRLLRSMLDNFGPLFGNGDVIPGPLFTTKALLMSERTYYLNELLVSCKQDLIEEQQYPLQVSLSISHLIDETQSMVSSDLLSSDINLRFNAAKLIAFEMDDVNTMYRKLGGDARRTFINSIDPEDGLRMLSRTEVKSGRALVKMRTDVRSLRRTVRNEELTIASLTKVINRLNKRIRSEQAKTNKLLERGLRDRIENTVPWDQGKAPEEEVYEDVADVIESLDPVPQYENGEEILVSMTSYPARIDTISQSIDTLLRQSRRANKILLWLAKEQFPGRENDLPPELLDMRKVGLEIKWVDQDLKSHKRYWYALQEYPDSLIIMFDDDLFYGPDYIDKLYKAHLEHPNAIIGLRTHRIKFTDDGHIAPYDSWHKDCSDFIGEERMDLLATQGAGTLWPPNALIKEAFDIEKLMKLAPTSDDIWLKMMATLAGTPVVLAAPIEELDYINGTQEISSLWSANSLESGNDLAIKNIIDEYNEYNGPDDTLLGRLRRDPE
ncbi:MAG: hypothetical protein ACOYIK_01615 [Coriobacteriales bacterium]